ncbi:dihydrouridine synthase [Tritrichomonas foetus]|uniref:Dihydrouridine synthase n=1 Tax=Tritrichomonas foetus TaxID=1144522 RepID=A0A1J4K8W4_9EUKA|nr:dihydrouridine synthase [Tritrichomonas foetus]|eukprot:OHT07378.1 dihydrouridine synthase [Tritrichomonas foetus]
MTAQEVAEKLYTDTLIAGPMVRGSSHIFRISCLEHGCDVVFSPGLVDLALIKSTRVVENDHVMLISESNGHKSVIFQTCEEEKGKIVLQLVSNDSANAIKASEILANDVVGYDLNCGCPESFACHRGSGSAIELETAVDIVKGLSRNTSKPVSVKFRVFPEIEKTIQFAKAIEAAGAKAITVHGRLKEQKHHGEVDFAKMKAVFDSVKICTIGNGGVTSRSDAERMKNETGCNAVMISGAALRNPSIFREQPLSEIEALAAMAKVGKQHHLEFKDCKWSLQQVLQSQKSLSKAMGSSFSQAQTWEEADEVILKNL